MTMTTIFLIDAIAIILLVTEANLRKIRGYIIFYRIFLKKDCICLIHSNIRRLGIVSLLYIIIGVVPIQSAILRAENPPSKSYTYVVAEEAGFASVRTLQRRIQDAIGMSPVDYRLIFTRDT